MRTRFSIQWLLTTLGMLEAQRSAQEVVQQQHLAPQDGVPAERHPLEPVLKEKTHEAHETKAAKRNKQNDESAIRPSSETSKTPNKVKELPPNENLKKLPDEVYGDTEIPRKHRNL